MFLNFLGRPTIGLTFDGPYGVYHSAYDNFYWMNQFGDPGYRYHTLMSKLWGALALRLANADLLPLDFGFYAANIRQFVEVLRRNNDARTHVTFDQLLKRIAEFETEGRRLQRNIASKLKSGDINRDLAIRVNRAMKQVETNWLNSNGIPGRPWFKHLLYAARYTYAHLELPGLTEAVERSDWKTANEQAALLEGALSANVLLLKSANNALAK